MVTHVFSGSWAGPGGESFVVNGKAFFDHIPTTYDQSALGAKPDHECLAELIGDVDELLTKGLAITEQVQVADHW